MIKDYYSHCYGIRVIDKVGIRAFIGNVVSEFNRAKKCFDNQRKTVKQVLDEGYEFTEDYLKLERSFSEIIATLDALGISINNATVVAMLSKIILKKKEFTSQAGAWEQYEQLATWLTYLASILELKESALKVPFLDAVLHSMRNMSYELYLGYSWRAYTIWDRSWYNIIPSNRVLIREFILENEGTLYRKDALNIVNK